jgi:ABC-type Na+ efflux pump permease subunit
MDIQPNDIWIAAGVLLGFQVASFTARINRETAVGEQRDITWLPPSDVLNLASMVTLIVGIFILPVFGFDDRRFMTYAFGLAMLLFMGYAFGLAGHYDMYNNKSKRSYLYFPSQEKVVVAIVAVLAITYVIIATIKSTILVH